MLVDLTFISDKIYLRTDLKRGVFEDRDSRQLIYFFYERVSLCLSKARLIFFVVT